MGAGKLQRDPYYSFRARMLYESREKQEEKQSVAQQSTLAASLLDGDAAVGLDASVGGPPLLTEVLEKDCCGGMNPSRLPLRC